MDPCPVMMTTSVAGRRDLIWRSRSAPDRWATEIRNDDVRCDGGASGPMRLRRSPPPNRGNPRAPPTVMQRRRCSVHHPQREAESVRLPCHCTLPNRNSVGGALRNRRQKTRGCSSKRRAGGRQSIRADPIQYSYPTMRLACESGSRQTDETAPLGARVVWHRTSPNARVRFRSRCFNPRPVPFPTGLVVKNGSKMRSDLKFQCRFTK